MALEALATEMSYADFERQLPKLGPALLHFPSEDGFLAILANSTLLSPDHKKVAMDPAAVRSALCYEMEAPVLKQIQETLESAEVPVSRQARAREAILRERLSAEPIRGIWLLRLPPSANFWLQLRQAGVPQRLVTLAGAHAIQYCFVDSGVVDGRTKRLQRARPELAGALGAVAVESGADSRANHLAARTNRDRRRRQTEAAAILRRAAIGAG